MKRERRDEIEIELDLLDRENDIEYSPVIYGDKAMMGAPKKDRGTFVFATDFRQAVAFAKELLAEVDRLDHLVGLLVHITNEHSSALSRNGLELYALRMSSDLDEVRRKWRSSQQKIKRGSKK